MIGPLANVRTGSKADVTLLNFNVRFTPESGLYTAVAECLLWAKSGCEQSQQGGLYSITSSARASNVCGMVTPSALAVLRLITNSNLVGC